MANNPVDVYTDTREQLYDELYRLNLLIADFIYRYERADSSSLIFMLSSIHLSDRKLGYNQNNIEQELKNINKVIKEKTKKSLQQGVFLGLPALSRLFDLSEIEEFALLVALAVELEPLYGKIYAALQQDTTKSFPSINLILELLKLSPTDKLTARQFFNNTSPLFRYRFLQKENDSVNIPFGNIVLYPDKRILSYVLGEDVIDERLLSYISISYPGTNNEPPIYTNILADKTVDYIVSRFSNSEFVNHGIAFYFYGDDEAEQIALVKAVCSSLGLPVIIGDISKMVGQSIPFNELIWLFAREVVLNEGTVCANLSAISLDNVSVTGYNEKELVNVMQALSRLIFMVAEKPWRPEEVFDKHLFISNYIKDPEYEERKKIWGFYIDKLGLSGDINIDLLASKFYLTSGQVKNAVRAAKDKIDWEDIPIGILLSQAGQEQVNHKLGELAQKITPKYSWEDIVLSTNQKSTLRDICNQAQYRNIVYQEWGFNDKFSLGKGLNILFSGPSGTGKTMAAEVIAKELGREIYKIDLSSVVSKYIGDTEKNLARIFYEGKKSNSILFFDECDAIVGRRSEVKDAHDRYANIEVGYLLQKFEEHEGIIIMASNLKKNIDDAFQRRMHFSVEFSSPDEEMRRMIWRSSFPSNAPLADDIDFDILALKFTLNGGSIKNATLHAAFLAAAESSVIRMEHIILAIRKEYQKMGNFMPRDMNEILLKNN